MSDLIVNSYFESFFNLSEVRLAESPVGKKLIEKARLSSDLVALVERVAQEGFVFVGDTPNHVTKSKAYTDFKAKEIAIDLTQGADRALLSLAYELTNANHADEFREIQAKYLEREPSIASSEEYAAAILKKESHSVFFRTKIASELNLQRDNSALKDFFMIYDAPRNQPEVIIKDRMFRYLKSEATVHQQRRHAFEHYQAQYFHCHHHPSAFTKQQAKFFNQKAMI